MNKNIFISGVIGLVLGVILAPVFTPIMPWGARTQIDSHFIEQMIPHHEDAIIMASLALENAEHQEIKTLAGDIISSQSEEIDQMEEWYKSWFGIDVPSLSFSMGHDMGMMTHGGMMGDETDISALENAELFDKEFIEQMIPHHQMAVMMAQMLSYSTSRQEMKQLAENIVMAQTKEINQMREWYNVWHEN